VVVTHATSYDVLVGGITLYLLRVIWTFGRKLSTINQDGRHEIVVRFFLPIFFIGGHARKSTKSTMLARFLRLPNGYDLLEGNIHAQDMPPESELKMLCANGKPSIHASPLDPTPPWRILSKL